MEMSFREEKGIVREAYIFSDHRRQDGNHSEISLCQISNRTNPRNSLVSGRTRASLEELADWSDCVSVGLLAQKVLAQWNYFVPKSLIVLETGLTPGLWETPLERVTMWMVTEKTPSDWVVLLVKFWQWERRNTGCKGLKSKWLVRLLGTHCSFDKCGYEIPYLKTAVFCHLQMLVDMRSQGGKELKSKKVSGRCVTNQWDSLCLGRERDFRLAHYEALSLTQLANSLLPCQVLIF